MTAGSRRYLKVLWHHHSPVEPVAIYCEISSGYEVRKVEVFRDGRHDYADTSHSTGITRLSSILTPTADEINQDPEEFSATTITASEFEQVWQRATRP
jgi:hypothetical protein